MVSAYGGVNTMLFLILILDLMLVFHVILYPLLAADLMMGYRPTTYVW